jgi:hypothetical protein
VSGASGAWYSIAAYATSWRRNVRRVQRGGCWEINVSGGERSTAIGAKLGAGCRLSAAFRTTTRKWATALRAEPFARQAFDSTFRTAHVNPSND